MAPVNSPRFHFLNFVAALLLFFPARAEIRRELPQPLPSHPGNIFVAGEQVIVPAPPGTADTWRMMNYEDKVVAKGDIKDGKVELGKLSVGFYKVVRGEGGQITNRTWLGVLEPLRAPTPETSPIAIDIGMAWFFPESPEKMKAVANFCQLAGINRVRDRLLWQELEPARGKFSGETRYDISARIQQEAGLKVLQVCHHSALWAAQNPKRFPPDLRDFYNFYKEMARRWKNKMEALEPWNEADLSVFGGHTGSEMASFQKAAYLGLKAGNPDVTACQNVFAIRRAETLADFNDNKAWAYFDTYNLHHYEQLEKYAELYADHRAISAGKPMWTTECSIRVKWRGDEKLQELSQEDQRLQSERVTKTYALALHEGPQAVFYFILPHYVERKLQYGLLRQDLTPRPGYVALAAVGRFLADAKPRGKIKADDPSVHGYLFDAKPDGKTAKVLVAWSTNQPSLKLSAVPEAVFDHLGRIREVKEATLSLSSAPVYAILPEKMKVNLVPPPQPPPLLKDKPGHVVLQALVPETEVVLEKSAYKMTGGETKTIPVFVYNFGASELRGKLKVETPKNWTAELVQDVAIAPGERKELTLKVTSAKNESVEAGIRITGDFGPTEKPLLALRFTAPVSEPPRESP